MSDTRRYDMLYDLMTLAKVKVTEGRNVQNGRFQKLSSTNIHVVNRLTVNYDTARRYLNFNETNFYILPCLASRDLQI